MVKMLVIVLIVISVIAIILYIVGSTLWNNHAFSFINRLDAYTKKSVERVNFNDLAQLPQPVQKYFRLVLHDSASIIQRASITQNGGFRVNPDDRSWADMKATQVFTTHKRGFVWNAVIKMAPMIKAKVIDSYIDGKGGMKGKVLSLITIINETPRPELNKAALQRYLAESVWFPTALLPGQGVEWTQIDEKTARATIEDSGITVSLDFEFNNVGEIVSVYTDERYREVDGQYKLFPWKGTFSDYMDIQGYRIPSFGQVAWILEDGLYSYWRATLTTIEYK